MAETVIAPLNDYADRDQTFGPFVVPNGMSVVDFKVRRCTTLDPTVWPSPDTRLQIFLSISLDGGLTFTPQGGIDSTGGIAFKKDGVTEQDFTIGGGGLPSGTNRRSKVRIIISGGPLRSEMSLIVA